MKNPFKAALMLVLSLLCFAIGFTILFANSAKAQEDRSGVFFGVLCYTEEATAASALAYAEGGIDLQNEVVDHLINVAGDCVRLSQDQALRGFIVYDGPVIGEKQVLGIAPNLEGPAQLFGLVNAPPPLPAKRGA